MKVGIVGCGTIGKIVAKAIDEEIDGLELTSVCDIDRKKAVDLIKSLRKKPDIAENIVQLAEDTDFIVESASADVVGKLLKIAVEKKKNVMIMSVGGVLDNLDLVEKIKKSKDCEIFFPSGAIVGIDGLNAARERKIQSVILTTSKPPKALAGAPYITQHGINLDSIDKPTVIFEGNCLEAVKAFPKNINISAMLSIAGVGVEKTKVRIIADPKLTRNIHKFNAKGEFGEMEVKVENVPSPANPKTSYIAALSAIATLKKMVSSVKLGT